MPQKLSEPIEDQLREYLVTNIDPNEIQGYDPQQSDTTASDFILITSDNDNYGDYYPLIFIAERDGPTIPNSGNTNANGKQGDGSGNNQYAIKNLTVQCQAVENGPYLNDTDYDQLVFELYAELQAVLSDASGSDFADFIFVGELTPPTLQRSSDEQDASTETWVQRAGTVPVGVQFTP